MRKIAIFYHCLFCLGNPPELLPGAFDVVAEQMDALKRSDLLEAATELTVGVNGGEESRMYANLIIPPKARMVYHGLGSRSENLTMLEMEEWLKTHEDWNVLYFHSKGATHTERRYIAHGTAWRRCMMKHLIWGWRKCVLDLNNVESVGCHWMHECKGTQNYWGGNFWWARSSFLRTLPSILSRERIRISGVESLESRYEAEVWIGNGSRLPSRIDYHKTHPGVFGACL